MRIRLRGSVPLGVLVLLLPLASAGLGGGGGNKDRVRLEDVQAISLEQGKWTNGRRVAAIPQLTCVGGNAGCHSNIQPRVVQCYNRGSDGYDVQWECKAADMHSAYWFSGLMDVSCEGYEYPDDPYVLRGSCGLKYKLDLTEEGTRQQHHGGQSVCTDEIIDLTVESDIDLTVESDDEVVVKPKSSFGWDKLITLVVLGVVICWALQVCCCARPKKSTDANPGGAGYASGSSTYSSVGVRSLFKDLPKEISSPGGAGYTSGSSTYSSGATGTGSGIGTGTGTGGGGMKSLFKQLLRKILQEWNKKKEALPEDAIVTIQEFVVRTAFAATERR